MALSISSCSDSQRFSCLRRGVLRPGVADDAIYIKLQHCCSKSVPRLLNLAKSVGTAVGSHSLGLIFIASDMHRFSLESGL
jgi:hypothetical protein